MNWRHLFDAARNLAGVANGVAPGPGRPRQVDLRRAVSTAYYAMFHALCGSNADTLVGATPTMQGTDPWVYAYRALEHGLAKDLLNQYQSKINTPASIRSFARVFGNLQEQRHEADYDPRKVFIRREVARLIDRAEVTTDAFWKADSPDRRELAACLLLSTRRSRRP